MYPPGYSAGQRQYLSTIVCDSRTRTHLGFLNLLRFCGVESDFKLFLQLLKLVRLRLQNIVQSVTVTPVLVLDFLICGSEARFITVPQNRPPRELLSNAGRLLIRQEFYHVPDYDSCDYNKSLNMTL